ncbi:MAG: glycosyltransferase [Ignavibacteriales bacterium]|nr:glycosyltransferase [Ignavibacteriales bacterium]
MGAVNFSLDLNLVKNLKKYLPLDIFVETGTFEGDTIENVRNLFGEIHSVELSEEYYKHVKNRFEKLGTVHLYLDSSEKFLKKVHPDLKEKSVLYWLDAHWCVADKTAGEKSQCPLIEELKSIESLNNKSLIIIDDARLFIAPPPSPHEITQWPDFNSIITLLSSLSRAHEVIILNDTIIYYPKSVKEIVQEYAYNNSINWLTVLDKSRDFDSLLKQQEDMLVQLKGKDEKIIDLSDDLVDKDKKIFELSDDLVEKNDTILTLSDDLVGKEKEIDSLLVSINEKNQTIGSLSDDLVGKEKEIDTLLEDLGEKKKVIISLSDDLVGKEKEIDTLLEDLAEKKKVIISLSEDLVEKDQKIFALSEDLVIKEETIHQKESAITSLSNELVDKEQEVIFLSESLSILKKRLSTPIWGLITLFQFHFPKIWNYLYNKKNKAVKEERVEHKQTELVQPTMQELEKIDDKPDKLEQEKIKVKKNKLKFHIPRLGQLNHYEPIELIIPKRYSNTRQIVNPLRLSIVTPSYNQCEFLERTIKSVLDQKYPNLEYIVQDGGSNDGSKEILNTYRKQLKSAKSEKDRGQTDAINKGFQLTSGDIMAWLNSDDVYLPGTFNYVINYFKRHPEVDVVYGHRVLINNCDGEIGRWVLPPHDENVLIWADFIPQETLFWRRRIWEKVGSRLNDEFDFALDWDLLLRFQEVGAKLVRLPRFLAAFRVHPNQKTSSQISSLGEKEMTKLRSKYIGENVSYPEINKKIFKYLLKSEIYHKLYRGGIFRY